MSWASVRRAERAPILDSLVWGEGGQVVNLQGRVPTSIRCWRGEQRRGSGASAARPTTGLEWERGRPSDLGALREGRAACRGRIDTRGRSWTVAASRPPTTCSTGTWRPMRRRWRPDAPLGAQRDRTGDLREPIVGPARALRSSSAAALRSGRRANWPAPVDITLLDRRNYHLFQPLLYRRDRGLVAIRDRLADQASVAGQPTRGPAGRSDRGRSDRRSSRPRSARRLTIGGRHQRRSLLFRHRNGRKAAGPEEH